MAAIPRIETLLIYRSEHIRPTASNKKPKNVCHSSHDRYSKLTRAGTTSKNTAKHTAPFFLVHRIVLFGIQAFLLPESGLQFVGIIFATLCIFLGVRLMKNTAYHSQTKVWDERYKIAIVARLRHYLAEHQENSDIFFQPLTFAYNFQVHGFIGVF